MANNLCSLLQQHLGTAFCSSCDIKGIIYLIGFNLFYCDLTVI